MRDKLRGTEKRADQWLELTEKTFNYATYARSAFLKGDEQKKKEILLTLGSNPILENQKLLVEAYKWFVPIAEDAPSLTEQYLKVRTEKNLSDKARTEAITSVRAHWLGMREFSHHSFAVAHSFFAMGSAKRSFSRLSAFIAIIFC